MKIGMDFGLSLGDKVDKSAAVNTQTGQTSDSGSKTRSFTISKCVCFGGQGRPLGRGSVGG